MQPRGPWLHGELIHLVHVRGAGHICGVESGNPFQWIASRGWRRGWDSNPRYACTHNGFRDRPDRPLWHLSAVGAALIGGRFPASNKTSVRAGKRAESVEKTRVSAVDLGGS